MSEQNEIAVENYTEVAVGKIQKLFGNNGELAISIYDTFPCDFNTEEEPIIVYFDGIATPLFFSSLTKRGKSKATVVFDDFDNEYRASQLIGKQMFIREEKTDECERSEDDDELYMEDLIGYEINAEGISETITITGFEDDEFNPLFTVTINGAEMLIPAHDNLIIEIDTINQKVIMNLPEGLFEL